jgi:signal transduction histidine kinase
MTYYLPECRYCGKSNGYQPMNGREPKGKPTFFWQGLLILLPVAVIAALAVGAIIKDRSAVETEVRQRAGNILEQMTPAAGPKFAFGFFVDDHLTKSEITASKWARWNLEDKLFPSGSPFRGLGEEEWTNPVIMQVRADVPERLIEESTIKFCPSFNPDGGMRPLWSGNGFLSEPPGNLPPYPPQWRTLLTPEQLVAWENLVEAACLSNNLPGIELALQQFKETKPPQDAVENAEFIGLRARLAADPSSKTIEELKWNRYSKDESGIPLSTLALIERLKLVHEAGNIRDLWDQIALDSRTYPNILTPGLIQMAEPLARRDPALRECLGALESRWAALEQMWAAGEMIQRSGKLGGVTPTNLWLDLEGMNYLCILQPETGRSQDDHGNITTNFGTASRFISMPAMVWALESAYKDVHVSIPDYFELTAEVAGSEPITLWPNRLDHPHLRGRVLAQFSRRDKYLGDAEYVLRIHVADEGLMLAAQRERAVVIGALLVVSILTALLGFFAARRAFYQQLRLNELKTNFVSSVSHELRAPIASVRLMAEGLERGKIQEPAKQGEYFKFIVQECRRLSSLIENVLDFSRIEEGRKRYELEATDVVALTEQTVKLMEVYAAERQTGITLQVNGEATPVEADGKALQQALVNLIDNAIKHSPKGAEVKVGLEFVGSPLPEPHPHLTPPLSPPSEGAEREKKIAVQGSNARNSLWRHFLPALSPHSMRGEGGRRPGEGCDVSVRISVEDHGEGIAASEHEKIFERFYRVGSELRRETQGVGIGLSIVKHIVEAHGGRVTVRSAPGQGSCFTIELPGNGKSKKASG